MHLVTCQHCKGNGFVFGEGEPAGIDNAVTEMEAEAYTAPVCPPTFRGPIGDPRADSGVLFLDEFRRAFRLRSDDSAERIG